MLACRLELPLSKLHGNFCMVKINLDILVFRLIDLTSRHRSETEMETERLRSSQLQAERTLEARERAHRQRVRGLEEQVQT